MSKRTRQYIGISTGSVLLPIGVMPGVAALRTILAVRFFRWEGRIQPKSSPIFHSILVTDNGLRKRMRSRPQSKIIAAAPHGVLAVFVQFQIIAVVLRLHHRIVNLRAGDIQPRHGVGILLFGFRQLCLPVYRRDDFARGGSGRPHLHRAGIAARLKKTI